MDEISISLIKTWFDLLDQTIKQSVKNNPTARVNLYPIYISLMALIPTLIAAQRIKDVFGSNRYTDVEKLEIRRIETERILRKYANKKL